MNTTARILAVSALSIFASLAHAAAQGEGANAPEFAPAFQSTASVSDVKAGALMPVHITNGSTGFIGVTDSGLSREAVRAQAVTAVRNGQIPHGEAS